MKQIFQDIRTGQTMVQEVPVPIPGPGMVLVRTAASLVSAGTERMVVEFAGKSLLGKARSRPDLVRQTIRKAQREGLLNTIEAVQNRLSEAMALGYSSAGEIAAVGEGVHEYRAGDRVACAGGGYAVHAEYAVVPVNLLAPLPENVSYETGAFATLGAIALQGFRLAQPQIGDRVAVIGLGLLGLLEVQIAAAAGCAVFGVDLNPARVELAKQLGIEAVLAGAAEQAGAAFSQGTGFDSVLICADTSSNDPVTLAGVLARDRARIVAVGAVGFSLPRKVYYEKELTFLVSRSYGPGRYDTVYEEGGVDYPIGYVRWTEGRNLAAVMEMVSKGTLNVEPLITHRFSVEQGKQAYDLIKGETEEPYLGVLFSYPLDKPVVQDRRFALHSKPAATEHVRLGAIGAGNFATAVLFPVLAKTNDVSLEGLATASGLKSVTAGKRFGFRYACTDMQQLLADEQVNTLAVLTRHGLHASQVVRGLQASKHVYCEKPLALNVAELDEIWQALEGSHRLLMVGFNRRFAPLAQKMKVFLEPVHEPLVLHYRVNAGSLPLSHWTFDPEQGGGRIIGEGCHFVDFLTWLTGALPVQVQSFAAPDNNRYREDNVVLMIQFTDGSIGSVSYLANGDKSVPKERVEVFGGGRIAVLDDYRSLQLAANGRTQTHRSRLRQDKGFSAEWMSFVSRIKAGGPPPIPYEHIDAVHRAVFAAVESLRSGQAVEIHSRAMD
ncbi:MAG: bi-domain-containing oxidoreductase [Anaerolineales bacterium]|nr:bi-domain-containing oxidoreductase [Anaerolineales bacterium]